jgi:hypothetical protein
MVTIVTSPEGGASGQDAGGGATASCAQEQTAALAALPSAQGYQSCQKDSDCVNASNDTHCSGGCGILVNQAGASAISSAIAQVNATICTPDCPAIALPCPGPTPGGPACLNGACASFPRAAWTSLVVRSVNETAAGYGTPLQCDGTTGCILWTVTPDKSISVARAGSTTTPALSPSDFSTVDTLLRSVTFRQNVPLTCNAPPQGQSIAFEIGRAGGTMAFDGTGCVLSGPQPNEEQRLFDVVKKY